MAASQTRTMKKRNYEKHQLRYNQVNLQHSMAATDNLMQVITTEKIGFALIQEPYLIQRKPQELSKDTEHSLLKKGTVGQQSSYLISQ